MATRGYSSYHGRGGRGGGGKTGWFVAVCVVLLLGAVAYFLSQRYLVYDEDGSVHWALPIDRQASQEQTPENPISPDDVVIDRQEPQLQTPVRRVMAEIHGEALPNGVLWWEPDYVLSEWEGDLLIEVKSESGGIRCDTSVSLPANVVVERGETLENAKALIGSGRYTVALVHCFCDSSFARGDSSAALLQEDGSLWYDGQDNAWLDPGNATTLAYLTALCRELGELGFSEILLDDFCYPTTGDTAALALPDRSERSSVLADFAAAIRKALSDSTALSVAIHQSTGAEPDDTGWNAEKLYGSFDRIYADSGVDVSALTALEGFDSATELAWLTYSRPDSGSYVLLG